MTFTADARSWVASRASKETRSAYARDLELWLNHCDKNKAYPGEPPTDVVIAFRNWLQDNRAPLSARRTLAALSSIYAGAHSTAANPFAASRLPRPPNSGFARTQAVSDEIARLIIAAAGERGEVPLRDRALLHVLYATGMRRVSAVSIRRDSIYNRGGLMILPLVLKGGRTWENELTPEAEQAVKQWLQAAPRSKWLFCTQDGSRALSPQAVTKILAKASAAVGTHVHPHQFRAAFITTGRDANIGLDGLAAVVGHRSTSTTQLYDRGNRGAGVVAKVAEHRERNRKD